MEKILNTEFQILKIPWNYWKCRNERRKGSDCWCCQIVELQETLAFTSLFDWYLTDVTEAGGRVYGIHPRSRLLIVWGLKPAQSFLLHPTLYPAHIWSWKTNRAFIYFPLHKCRKYLHFQGKYLCIFKVDSKTNWIHKLKQIYLPAGQCLSEALKLCFTDKNRLNVLTLMKEFHLILSSCFWWNLCSSLPLPFISSNGDSALAKTQQGARRKWFRNCNLCFSCFWRTVDGWAASICRVPFAFEHNTVAWLVHSVSHVWSIIFHLGMANLAFFSHCKGASTKDCHGTTAKETHYLKTMWHPQFHD